MKIQSLKDGDMAYEKREYVKDDWRWCVTRNGEVIRWMDTFEVDKIESVIVHMENK